MSTASSSSQPLERLQPEHRTLITPFPQNLPTQETGSDLGMISPEHAPNQATEPPTTEPTSIPLTTRPLHTSSAQTSITNDTSKHFSNLHPKSPTESDSQDPHLYNMQSKKPRGRPRKHRQADHEDILEAPIRKKRGRPRKY